MRKILTLFVRDPNDRAHVLPEVTPECEWVLTDPLAVATRKYDGTCVLFEGSEWWARREVKRGGVVPSGFCALATDPVTGKTVGWVPIDQSPFFKYFREALNYYDARSYPTGPGTFELIGPKINGNPENVPSHRLIRHADAEQMPVFRGMFVDPVEAVMHAIRATQAAGWEGLVWHHPDGRMAKLKVRDFARPSVSLSESALARLVALPDASITLSGQLITRHPKIYGESR